MSDARGVALCVRPLSEGPDEPARDATYPTRGSKPTERTPEREGADEERGAQIGVDRDLSRGAFIGVGVLTPMVSDEWKAES